MTFTNNYIALEMILYTEQALVDFDLDPMTLALKLDLDTVKIYICTGIEIKLIASAFKIIA